MLAIATACGRISFDPYGGDDGGGTADAVPMIAGRHWVDPNAGGPGALIAPRLAYVPGRGLVMYGGATDPGTVAMPPMMPVATMWLRDATGWSVICDPCAPGKRIGHALAYDTHRRRLVLQGGIDETGTTHGEMWEWDGTTWAQTAATGPAPSPRGLVGMAYDDRRQKMVVIGGELTGPVPTNEIYEYDGATWTHPQPAGGPTAVSCGGQCATYDSALQRVVVLADRSPALPGLDEVWAWDGATWSQVCATCTGHTRTSASLVYDPATRTFYEIGGWDINVQQSIAGTWQSTAGTWPLVSAQPDRRDSSGVAWDAGRNVIVLYGGNGEACGGNCAETWELVPD